MYIPEIFKNENKVEIEQFVHDNGFAILINQVDGKLWATHTPLLLEVNALGKPFLSGHISIENKQGDGFKQNDEVLAIFSGTNAYISSSWYDHENVPTWNYIAVHIYGKIKILSFEDTLKSLEKLVNKYEVNSKNPIKIENLSSKTMLQARSIIAFEIDIEKIEAKKKISQNRDSKNYKNIISELEKTQKHNEINISQEMKRNLK